MIIGNQQAQDAIASYFQAITSGNDVGFPFLLLSGPDHIGKTTCVEKYIYDLLGIYIKNDYLPVYDMSSAIGKQHNLKIEVAQKDQLVQRDEGTYVDVGARDIVKRLSMSPTGTYKIVFLENIERMTLGAANALLKTREEPLPKRIIIATTANKSKLLDTILSRAFVIQFQIPPVGEVHEYVAKRYPEKTEEQRMFAVSFSLGRVGLAKKLLDHADDAHEYADIFAHLLESIQHKGSSVTTVYQLFQKLAIYTTPEQLIDAVMYASMHINIPLDGIWMHTRNMLSSNVNQDTLLFNLAVQIC